MYMAEAAIDLSHVQSPGHSTPRPSPTPQPVRTGAESQTGIRGKIGGLLGRGRGESSEPTIDLGKVTDRGVIAAINTGDKTEISAAVDYATAKPTREAAFATREKRIEHERAMSGPLNDRILGDRYLDQLVQNDPMVRNPRGGDRSTAEQTIRARISEQYKQRAETSRRVTDARNTGNQAEIEDAISIEAQSILQADAKQDLARRMGAKGTPIEALGVLAADGGHVVIESNAAGMRVLQPDGKVHYIDRKSVV